MDIAGLKSKKIAVTFGQCNELLLLEALARSGLKQSEVTLVNMDADAAGAAFIAGRLDAAVTWEPWVTQVTSSGKGHVLFSSKQAPNIIFDSAAVTRRFAAGHKKEIEAFIRGLDAGGRLSSLPSARDIRDCRQGSCHQACGRGPDVEGRESVRLG